MASRLSAFGRTVFRRRWLPGTAVVGAGALAGAAGSAAQEPVKAEPLDENAVLLVAVGFGIGGYLLGLQRGSAAGAPLTDEVTSALSVLDEHFRDMDAKDGAGGGAGFASSTGVNHLELFKWKANVPHVQVVAARRTMADLAATVPSLGPSTLLSGGALSGSASGADLAVVAHFSSADELEAYQRSAERRSAIESIRPLLAEAPTTATFGNDVPAVLAERSGRSIAALGSGGAGEQMGQAEYEAAVELLAAYDGRPSPPKSAAAAAPKAAAAPVKRVPPPPPSSPPPTTADEANAILEAHFAKTAPAR